MKLLLGAFLILAAALSVTAQEADVLVVLNTKVLDVEKRFANPSPELAGLLREVLGDIRLLKTRHTNLVRRGVNLSDKYMSSLPGLVNLLTTALDGAADQNKLIKILSAVHVDLEVKASYLVNARTKREERTRYERVPILVYESRNRYYYWQYEYRAVGTYYVVMVEDVAVTVHTKVNANETRGYEIWYVTAGEEDFPNSYKSFGSLSSPATWSLPPGGYRVWAKKGSFTTERKPMTVGGQGSRQDQDIDVTPK
jgi:hypothetical protein